MDISRAEKIAEVIKGVTGLGKTIKKPATFQSIRGIQGIPGQVGPNSRLPAPVEGTGFVRILMYIGAGILTILIILLIVDQWITPVFQRTPGGAGYIPIPGIDNSQLYWMTPDVVDNITVGAASGRRASSGAASGGSSICLTIPSGDAASIAAIKSGDALSTTVVENQPAYSITFDVFIKDPMPQTTLGLKSDGTPQNQRILFLIGPMSSNDSVNMSGISLDVTLDNTINTLCINVYDSNHSPQSVTIENVPIYKPFRIGIVVTQNVLEGYLNGFLVKTKPLLSIPNKLATGMIIYAPTNIKSTIATTTSTLSSGISVLNVRTFGYAVSPSEMQGRMSDLVSASVINPKL